MPAVVPPLGLPVGSVRALVTLSVLATIWWQLYHGSATSPVLRDTLLLVLGYYFGARGAKAPAADALAGAAPPRESNPYDPLYLPRGSVRLLILLGFGGVAYKLYGDGKLVGPTGPPPLLVLVGTFLAGTAVRATFAGLGRFVAARVKSFFGHALALGTLGVVVPYCLATALGHEHELDSRFVSAFVGIVGFYLGKR